MVYRIWKLCSNVTYEVIRIRRYAILNTIGRRIHTLREVNV